MVGKILQCYRRQSEIDFDKDGFKHKMKMSQRIEEESKNLCKSSRNERAECINFSAVEAELEPREEMTGKVKGEERVGCRKMKIRGM